MDERVRQALAIDRSSSAWDRTVDITTIGARTGRQRRIEVFFYRAFETCYLSSTARRDWYANLVADPRFTFHLKHGVRADLDATAIPITDQKTRRRVFEDIVADLNQPSNPGRIRQPTMLQDWMAGSPLARIVFED